MSHVAFDFLSESVLLDEAQIESKYAGMTDPELVTTLEQYREHVLSRGDELRAEAARVDGALSISFDTSSRARPSIDLLKQCALYFDRAIVDDPLFPLTKKPRPSAEALNENHGLPTRALDREAIASAAQFMRSARPMTAGTFLKFAPTTAVLEPPDKTPITYSATLYEERIPEALRDWIRNRARVSALRKHTGREGWYWRQGDPLEPCRAIAVSFEGQETAFTYFLFSTQAEPHSDGEEGHVILTQWMPDTPPPPAQFQAWVAQSVNQSGGKLLEHLHVDMTHANHSGSMLLTQSSLLGELLTMRTTGTRVTEDLAQLALQLDLPILGAVSVDDLMNVRNQYGEAFHNCRLALQKHLRELRMTDDRAVITKKLENVQHELQEIQVAEVEKEVRRVKREVLRSLVIGAVSLGAVVPTTGWSLAGVAAAAVGAYRAGTGYSDRVKEHPAFLLWKLKQAAS
jgi:hypothetical protein